ncbi:hypothetical protein [Streptomyces sp. SID4982]|uniref:hypothetical protein n=1 Tax=Streptomyces sp. SID4982 TaxID=2690291 RepID=UPI00136F5C5E|nr:hypothetical protein [Streptomyces sp. SID4982]MYS16886.1 hypothetical protein [Streptomyces sp. SID4982]
MTEEQAPPCPLTDLQRARIDYARRDLDYTRSEDLTTVDAAGLILIVEKLRGRLGDMLDLIDEVRSTDSPEGNTPSH